MAERVKRDDLVLVKPAWLRGKVEGRMGVGVIGLVIGIQSVHCNG